MDYKEETLAVLVLRNVLKQVKILSIERCEEINHLRSEKEIPGRRNCMESKIDITVQLTVQESWNKKYGGAEKQGMQWKKRIKHSV